MSSGRLVIGEALVQGGELAVGYVEGLGESEGEGCWGLVGFLVTGVTEEDEVIVGIGSAAG